MLLMSPGHSRTSVLWLASVWSGICLLMQLTTALAQEGISREQIEAVSAATFEVVLEKPVVDHLTYERPLPMDLVPYSVRTDPYYSVGTAFALNDKQWVTAAHVLDLGSKSLHKVYRLRDSQGNVYDLDKIYQYSKRRDFVVFTIKNQPKLTPIPVNTSPRVNDTVYAVGNAYGEGIVFRDGRYTSATPEDQDGEWQWIRFSAAASPGNSGGPLLDEEGRVIGVIMGKSENENLNFALPMNEILSAPADVADLDLKMGYSIDHIPNSSLIDRLQKKIKLPLGYDELDKRLNTELFQFGLKLKDAFLARESGQLFPNGDGSLQMLNSDYESAAMMGILARGQDGEWGVYFPEKTETFDLGKNGSLISGAIGNSSHLRLLAPDDVKPADLFTNSTVLMDLILRGNPLFRTVGSEKVKITSMGKASEEYTHVDRYDRKWQVRVWNIDFSDEQVVLFALPVPGGFKGMMRIVSTEQMPGQIEDLKILADFIYVSYYGVLKDWRDFLSRPELLPKVFSHLKIDFDYGKQFHYASDRVAFGYTADEMKITEESDLKLRLSYFVENGRVVWDVTSIRAGDHRDNNIFYAVVRNFKPDPRLDSEYQSAWNKILQKENPYDRTAFFSDNRTVIGDVVAAGKNTEPSPDSQVLYTVFYSADGSIDPQQADGRLAKVLGQLTVLEAR